MNKLIASTIIILLLLFGFSSKINNTDYKYKFDLTKKSIVDDTLAIKILLSNIAGEYGNSFEFTDEIVRQNYAVVKHSNSKFDIKFNEGLTIEINRNSSGILDFNRETLNKHVNQQKFKQHQKSMLTYTGEIEVTNNMLRDMEILSFDDYVGKIFNRSFAEAHIVETHSGNSTSLFQNLEDIALLPYDDGADGKVLSLDGVWSTVFYTDENILSTGINHYGEMGSGTHQFAFPTGICYGRESENGSTTTYPIYICDNGNSRITKTNFVAVPSDNQSVFDGNSYAVINSDLKFPYDVAYFLAPDTSKGSDKLWFSELGAADTQFITCMETDGSIIQRFSGYKNDLTGEEIILTGRNLPRLSVFNGSGGVRALAFVDNMKNRAVFTLLSENGECNEVITKNNGTLILASHTQVFPAEYPINSIFIQQTAYPTADWPYVWITSGYSPPYYSENTSMVHLFKMNKSSYTQYLGSSYRPRNSSLDFKNLRNIALVNQYHDIYTIENWNDNYGIRKFLPYADIRNDSLFSYCEDSISLMRFKGTFTNDCYLYITAQRKNRLGNWENVNIKKLNGYSVNGLIATKYQRAGWNHASYDLFVDIELDLPFEDIALGGEVKMNLKLYPDWADPNNLGSFPYSVVENSYEAPILRYCLPKPGGCPFLYVKDENNNFTPDNNLLHKMEFSTPSTDITDKYKLRIKPLISGGKIETYIVENEDDISLIDQVKLYAVDYPPNRKVAVTEYNQVVLYDSAAVYGADTVLQNYTVNVTNDLHFHHPGAVPLVGNAGDSMYAHFNYFVPQKINKTENTDKTESTDRRDKSKIDTKADKHEERAFSKQKHDKLLSGIGGTNLKWAFISDIGNLTNPVPSAKDTAGFLSATSVYNNITAGIFSRRELNSVVVLPLFADTDLVNNIDIKWQSDHKMKYLGIAALEYGGYDINEIPLAEANYITNSLDSEITAVVLDIDGEYTEVSSTSLLKMKFDASGLPELTRDYKREYIFEVTGQYSDGQSSDHSRKSEEIPLTYRLSQNYPNPFNPVTKINYELPKNSNVNLVIYDILGREVIRLLNNEFKQPGRYTVEFDGKNFASGIYFYRIEAGNFVQS